MQTESSGINHQAHESFRQPRYPLPNANLILVLGIFTILLCWMHFISFAGIILGIITLVLAGNEMKRYHANPGLYTESSLNNVRAGRICALIGLVISLIVFVFVLLLIFGILATLPFWGMIPQL